jgi:hypothetical protein
MTDKLGRYHKDISQGDRKASVYFLLTKKKKQY